jgi:hypothetical protein
MKDILRSTGVLLLDSEKNKLEALNYQIVFTIKGRELSYNNNGYNFTDECKEYTVQLKRMRDLGKWEELLDSISHKLTCQIGKVLVTIQLMVSRQPLC